MEERYKPDTKKGKMPLKTDLLLYYLFKSLIGAVFLYILLYSILPSVRADPHYSFINEIFVIIPLIVVSDILGNITSKYIVSKTVKHYNFDKREKGKNNDIMRMKTYIEYTIYLVFRVLWFILGLFWLLYGYFVDNGIMFAFAFLTTCLLMNLTTKIIAWIITHVIFF